MFDFERVIVPEPVFVNDPVPLIIPSKAAGLVLSPPTVKVAAPNVILPPVVPPPVMEPILLLYPVISKATPDVLSIYRYEFEPNAEVATPAFKIPP